MDKIIEITQNLLQKQGRNQKNFIYFQIPIVVCIGIWDILIVLVLISMVKHNMIDTLFLSDTLLLIMLNYTPIINIKRFNRVNSAVQYHVIPKLIDINNFDSTNNWLTQNKHLFPKTIIGRLFSNRMNYWVWGCIETNDNYQVVIIDLSKKNTLIVLTIEKKDLNSYTESKFLTKLIKRIPKIKKFNELWFKKYFFSHLNFYIYE